MRSKQIPILLTVVALLAVTTWYLWPAGESGPGAGADSSPKSRGGSPDGSQPAIDVGFVDVAPVPVSRTEELPGRVVSYQVAEIRPQVSGIIQSRLFEEGSYVDEGQQLYQIDPARYEAAVQRAQAALEEAHARQHNARNQLDRFETLVDHNAVSRQEYDDAQASFDAARAAVSLAEAELETARIDLEYTRVYAPISGYISPSTVTRGALVTARQERPLATIRQLDPVYVDLAQTAAETRNLHERLMKSRGQSDKSRYEVTLQLDGSAETYPHTGVLDATDIAVDVQTGAIRLRSVFPNPDDLLLPGMFVRASIEAVGEASAITVPQKSVNIEPDGSKSVWLVGKGETAKKQPVRTGAAYDDRWVIVDGLERGDRLITEGTMQLREGAALKPEKLEIDGDGHAAEIPPDTLQDRAPPPRDPASPTAETGQAG